MSLARLKHLPPRPPIKPSGMDKSTQAEEREAGDKKSGRSCAGVAANRQAEVGALLL